MPKHRHRHSSSSSRRYTDIPSNIVLATTSTFGINSSGWCTPAKLYFFVSIIGFILSIIENMGNGQNHYSICNYFHTSVPNIMLIFAIKLAVIFFWSWILNLICRDGYSDIAWLLVLLPFILFFATLVFISMQ